VPNGETTNSNLIVFGLTRPTVEPTIYHVMVSVLASSEVDRGFIGGVMVSVLASSEIDRGFIDGVMVSLLTSREVVRGFIGGVMVSVPASSVLDHWWCNG
jgi:hypothetical protein